MIGGPSLPASGKVVANVVDGTGVIKHLVDRVRAPVVCVLVTKARGDGDILCSVL